MSWIAPKRVALDLTDGQLRALQLAHVNDDIPITTRVRALVALWMARPELAEEAAELAMRDVERLREIRKPRHYRQRINDLTRERDLAISEVHKERRLREIATAFSEEN